MATGVTFILFIPVTQETANFVSEIDFFNFSTETNISENFATLSMGRWLNMTFQCLKIFFYLWFTSFCFLFSVQRC